MTGVFETVTPMLIVATTAVIGCVILLATVIARAVTGRRQMRISLKWLGLSLEIDASPHVEQRKDTI